MKPHKAAALSGENIPKHGMKCIMNAVFQEENYYQIRLVKSQRLTKIYPPRSTQSRDIATLTSGYSHSRVFPSTLNQQKNIDHALQTKTLPHVKTITLYANMYMAM